MFCHLFSKLSKLAELSKLSTNVLPLVFGVSEVIEVNGVNDGSFYDLNGRKVNAPTKKGVYLFNGRKVVVR